MTAESDDHAHPEGSATVAEARESIASFIQDTESRLVEILAAVASKWQDLIWFMSREAYSKPAESSIQGSTNKNQMKYLFKSSESSKSKTDKKGLLNLHQGTTIDYDALDEICVEYIGS